MCMNRPQETPAPLLPLLSGHPGLQVFPGEAPGITELGYVIPGHPFTKYLLHTVQTHEKMAVLSC